jgi:putative ABC transport system permease protein
MKKIQPPSLAKKLFLFYSGTAKVDDLLGDLDELFIESLKTTSPAKARRQYWSRVFSLLTSYTLRKRKRDARLSIYSSSISAAILHNYFKIAIRNMYQHRYFTVLNAFGLAIGMSVSLLLISLYSFVKTYDDFHLNKATIYTLTTTRTEGIEEEAYATAPVVVANHLRDNFSGVQEVLRIQRGFNESILTKHGDVPLSGYYTEPAFFSVFTFPVLYGNPIHALTKPNTLVLTASAAQKIFNNTNVVGQSLAVSSGEVFEVGAVMQDHPKNSHLRFEVLVSYTTLAESTLPVQEKWTNYDQQYVYVLLHANANIKKVVAFANATVEAYTKNAPINVRFQSQHLQDIAMGPDFRQAIGPKWEASGMIVFMIIAALILLPACFNYANISIARALKRTKEIGLRKTMGGVNSQIFFQFITETVMITMLSLAGAMLLFFLARGEFKSMLVAGSMLDLSLTWNTAIKFILFAIGTGFVAGVFPALFFARLNPIQALKSKTSTKVFSGLRVRKGLTIFQFALSFGFILSIVVFSKQYKYSLNYNMGFEKENIVNVELQDAKQEIFKTAFSSLSPVQRISMSSGLLGLSFSTTWVHSETNDSTEVAQLFVDEQFLNSLKLQLLAGRNFPEQAWQAEKYIIVNEEFLKYYKIERAADAIDKSFIVEGMPLQVIGVVKNFNYASLRTPIGKFFFRCNPSQYTYANLAVQTTDAFGAFTMMEQAWEKMNSPNKLKARYFKDELSEAYADYRTTVKICGFLGLLAITISLLGMLGMVIYTSESKTKEVGIRKVMGAGTASITYLLSREYLLLMFWGILMGLPICIFLFSQFLSQIQYYSTTLSVIDVVYAILLLTMLGLLTIASQTYKTASINPAESLKCE